MRVYFTEWNHYEFASPCVGYACVIRNTKLRLENDEIVNKLEYSIQEEDKTNN